MSESASAPDTRAAESDEVYFSWTNQAILIAALTVVSLLAIFGIRLLALRVTQYEVSVFETYARQALASKDFGRVVEICNGAMRAGVNRSDHHGLVYLLRAQGFAGEGDITKALDDYDSAALFSQESHYFMPEPARQELMAAATAAAEQRLKEGDAPGALRAFSDAAIGSGNPVDYLYTLKQHLSDEEQQSLWGEDKPWLVVRRFDNPAFGTLEPVVEEQGRSLLRSGVDQGSGFLELSPSSAKGRSAYGDKLYLPVSEQPFSLRVVAKGEGGPMPQVLLGYWFEAARESAHTFDDTWTTGDDGWQACLISRDFYRERLQHATKNGYSMNDGVISLVALELAPDSANKLWLDRVELVLP
ncbi:MAG: hypothetical protein GC168_20065 [Candidatus Hydrogenedens sp.]|nr:hypothetical protein [Candidatus Hydrogenedens sp.]